MAQRPGYAMEDSIEGSDKLSSLSRDLALSAVLTAHRRVCF